MSLSLNVPQPTGAMASFWTLNCITLNAITHVATIKLDGFLDAESQLAGYYPLTSTIISVTFIPTNVISGVSIMQALYAKIQLDPFFTGATYTDDNL